VASWVSSKDSFDEGVLGGGGKEVLLFVLMVLGLVGGDVGEDIKTEDRGGRDGSTGNDVGGAVRNVEKGVVLRVIKDGPGKFGGWGTRDDGLEDAGSDVERTWVVPSVVRALEDL